MGTTTKQPTTKRNLVRPRERTYNIHSQKLFMRSVPKNFSPTSRNGKDPRLRRIGVRGLVVQCSGNRPLQLFRTCCLLHLGLDLPQLPTFCKCRQAIDPTGYHVLTCVHWTTYLTRSHDALLRQLMILSSAGGVKAQNNNLIASNELKWATSAAPTSCHMAWERMPRMCTRMSQLDTLAREVTSTKPVAFLVTRSKRLTKGRTTSTATNAWQSETAFCP